MGYRACRQRAGIFIQQQPGIVGRDGVAAWRRLDRDLRGVHDAGRRDQADDERAVEHWRQSDGDDLTGWDRMISPLTRPPPPARKRCLVNTRLSIIRRFDELRPAQGRC